MCGKVSSVKRLSGWVSATKYKIWGIENEKNQ